MNTLNFNRKSWHSALYQSSYGTSTLPDNICAYFWKLVFGIIMFPFAIAGHIINSVSWLFHKKPYGSHICTHAIWTAANIPIFLVLGMFAMDDKTHMIWDCIKGTPFNLWWSGGLIAVGIVIVLIILVICGQVIDNWRDSYRYSRSQREKTPSPIKEGFKAFKGKYCSRISWN